MKVLDFIYNKTMNSFPRWSFHQTVEAWTA